MRRQLSVKLLLSILLLALAPNALMATPPCEDGPDHRLNDIMLQLKASFATRYLDSLPSPTNDTDHPEALVFDIDETVLSNWPELKHTHCVYQPKSWSRWIHQSQAPAIEPVVALLKHAQDRGYKILFLTGRDTSKTAATVKNLHNAGINHWSQLVLRKPDERCIPAGIYKAQHRENLSKKYHIVMNVGDQASDFYGKHNGFKVKLENPYYEIPSTTQNPNCTQPH